MQNTDFQFTATNHDSNVETWAQHLEICTVRVPDAMHKKPAYKAGDAEELTEKCKVQFWLMFPVHRKKTLIKAWARNVRLHELESFRA